VTQRSVDNDYKGAALVNAAYGDVNGNGTVTSANVTALYNWPLNNDNSSLVNGDVSPILGDKFLSLRLVK